MLKSMTAYGRSVIESPIGRITCELQSVNRKFLETNVYIPRELNRFDNEIKKWVNASIGRGAITVKFNIVFDKTIPMDVTANIPLAIKIQKAAQDLAKALNLSSSEDLLLKLLSEERNLLVYDDFIEQEDVYKDALKEAFDLALDQFVKMKSQEGASIFNDISKRVKILKENIEKIAFFAPEAPKKYREKLMERLKEFMQGTVEDEERILKEVSFFAEKVDISEEITLFEAHLKRFSDLMESNTESIAKTLEFLIQELNRETNTIGSKSSELEVSRRVIEIKGELEKIREMIQNVE
jgi:uncharacterized protein (TIGR00255 family)